MLYIRQLNKRSGHYWFSDRPSPRKDGIWEKLLVARERNAENAKNNGLLASNEWKTAETGH